MLERFPDIVDLDGNLATLAITTKLELEGEVQRSSERYIYKIELEGTQPQEWYNNLEAVKGKLVRDGRAKIALYPPVTDPGGVKTRKLLECILYGTNTKGLIYVKEKPGRKSKGETEMAPRVERERDTEVVIVRDQGKTYADLLREVKDNVKVGTEAAKSIRTIREARNGHMIIVVDKKDKGGTEELREKLRRNNNTVSGATGKGKMVSIIIKDIDSLTTVEEIKDAIIRETGTL